MRRFLVMRVIMMIVMLMTVIVVMMVIMFMRVIALAFDPGEGFRAWLDSGRLVLVSTVDAAIACVRQSLTREN